jgi:hypothetical protein
MTDSGDETFLVVRLHALRLRDDVLLFRYLHSMRAISKKRESKLCINGVLNEWRNPLKSDFIILKAGNRGNEQDF